MKKYALALLLSAIASNASAGNGKPANDDHRNLCNFKEFFSASAHHLASECSEYIYENAQISSGKRKRGIWKKTYDPSHFGYRKEARLEHRDTGKWVFMIKQPGGYDFSYESLRSIQYNSTDLGNYLKSIGKTVKDIGFRTKKDKQIWYGK